MSQMKVPGPDHPITVSADTRRLQVRYGDHVIADSADVLSLAEAGYQPAAYFPREDVAMAYLTRTDRVTHCPYKGEASYYTILMDGRFAENAVWSYEDPYPAMDEIRGRIAFYPNQVDIYAVSVAADPNAVREAVEHTDDGAGMSQKEPWPPNAGLPRES